MVSRKPAGQSGAHVALLRGINVGGKRIVPMKDLAAVFTDAGCRDVRTYIQSGNVVFNASSTTVHGLRGRLEKKIQERFGFAVPIVLRSAEQLARTIASNPFLVAGVAETALHVYFLADLPSEEAAASLDHSRSTPDAFIFAEQEIYLHLPNGMGRTKLTNAYFDSRLATTCTARNWATVLKLAAMMRE
jgi:uncharacterized protein (DUF1697 family)